MQGWPLVNQTKPVSSTSLTNGQSPGRHSPGKQDGILHLRWAGEKSTLQNQGIFYLFPLRCGFHSLQGDAFSLIPNTSYFRYISCCLWDVIHDSIKHNLIFCSKTASLFYGMSFSNNGSSFNGILITCFVVTVQQQLLSCDSKSSFFSLQALTWLPIPIVSEHLILFSPSDFSILQGNGSLSP